MHLMRSVLSDSTPGRVSQTLRSARLNAPYGAPRFLTLDCSGLVYWAAQS